MTAFFLLVAATVAVGLLAMAVAYVRTRDPFHPLLVACPIALFVYGYMPFALRGDATLAWYVAPAALARAQAVFLLLLAAFCAGTLAGSGHARWDPRRRVAPLSPEARRRLLGAGLVVGAAGLAVWRLLLASEGGLAEVYNQPHGGDVLHPSGWVREMTRLSLVGVLLTMAAGRALAPRLLALAFAAPTLVHAALGTRRGPLYVAAVLLLAGYYLFEGKRPRLVVTVAGGVGLGLLLLFLLANRARVYYGSPEPITFDLTDSIAFRADPGNDYLVAAALVTAADEKGQFGWGLSYVEQLFIRPIPRELLPDKYEILQEQTVAEDDVAETLGWRPPPGWVPTLFAHLYTEFGWLGLLASALIGWAHGWTWRRSVESPVAGWLTLQVLMLVGLLHLITQGFWAMAVPLLLMFVPAWAALRWALERPFRRLEPLPGAALAAGPDPAASRA